MSAIVVAAAWLRFSNLDYYTGSFDEGIRSQQLLLMSAGYRPFRDIFSSQGPLLLDLLFPLYLLFGQSLEAARAAVALISLVGLLGGWWLGRLVGGRLAGIATGLILAASPGYLEGSRLALAEVPTIAPAMLSLGAALVARRTGRVAWLLVAAVCCALALLVKPLVIHVLAPLALVMLAPSAGAGAQAWRRSLADAALFGLVVGLVCGLAILLLGPTAVWNDLGAYRTSAGHALGTDWRPNLRLVANLMARERLGLVALAALGAVAGLARSPVQALAPIAWAGAIGAMFLLYGDLADKHVVYLIPPVAVLAGVGAGFAVSAVRRAAASRRPRVLATAAVGLLAVAWYVADLREIVRFDTYLIWDSEDVAARRRDRASELEIVQIMRDHAAPSEWVLSDNPGAAYEAGRMVIPSLVDTSGTRIDAGSLTTPLVVDAVTRYRPKVIVTWSRRLGRLDDFTRWLPLGGYRLEREYDNGWKVYLRQ